MKLFIACTFFLVASQSQAQFGKKLKERVKEVAEQKANQKIDEKINNGVDKGVEKIDSVITGKKKLSKKEKRQQSKSGKTATVETNNPTANGNIDFESSELVFQTSVKGKMNRNKIEPLLKDLDGVSNVMIDEDTGTIYITPTSGADVEKAITDLLKKNGFTVTLKK